MNMNNVSSGIRCCTDENWDENCSQLCGCFLGVLNACSGAVGKKCKLLRKWPDYFDKYWRETPYKGPRKFCGLFTKAVIDWSFTPLEELWSLVLHFIPNLRNVLFTGVHIIFLGWQWQYLFIVIFAGVLGLILKNNDDLVKDPSGFIGGLSSDNGLTVIEGLLTFIIPLSLESAMNRNKTGVDAFNAFTGEIVALAWQVLNMSKDFGYLGTLQAGTVPMKYKRILDLLTVLPETAKHEQRGDSDIQKLYINDLSKIDERDIIFKRQKHQIAGVEKLCATSARIMKCNWQQLQDDESDEQRIKFVKLPWAQRFFPQEGFDDLQQNIMFEITGSTPLTQRLMATLMGEITKIRNDKDNETANHLMAKWQSLYGEYGTMGNMMSYKKPLMFENVLYLALLLFVFALNINMKRASMSKSWGVTGFSQNVAEYEETSPDDFNPWIGVFSVYFMVMLKCVSTQIGNPFLPSRKGFLTVTGASRNATQQLEEIRYLVENKRQNAFTTVREKRHILGRESVSTAPAVPALSTVSMAGTVMSMSKDAPIPRIKY